MFDFMLQISFSIAGLSKDKQVYAVLGSGFFIAPYTALTATHVVRASWDTLEMPWNKGKYPKTTKDPAYYLAASQQIHQKNEFFSANWEITGVSPLLFTDIAFLNLVPMNEVAAQFLWPKEFPELMLLPPSPKSRVWAHGYPGATHDHRPGESLITVTAEPTLIEGEVIADFQSGRGSWSFPQFEVTCPFEPGMSGGPVVSKRRICGVISYGPELEGGERGPSFAAAIWPILAAQTSSGVDPRSASNPALEMIQVGSISAPGWKELQKHISKATSENGDSIVTLNIE